MASWKKFIVDNYHSFTNEVWQLGSDARAEAGNILSELTRKLDLEGFITNLNVF